MSVVTSMRGFLFTLENVDATIQPIVFHKKLWTWDKFFRKCARAAARCVCAV